MRTINVNLGCSSNLLEKCPTLYGYAYFVAAIRKNLKFMELRAAVETAVDECIDNNILKEFLLEQKAEVVAMSIYEYNEEYVKKTLLEEGEEKGEEKSLLTSIGNLMESMHWTMEQSMSALLIPAEKQTIYKKMLEK